MKRVFYIAISALLFLSLSACRKYLDQKSDSTLVVPTSIADLQGLLDDIVIMNQNTPAIGEKSADDYFLLNGTYNSGNNIDRGLYTWREFYYQFGNDYNRSATALFNANYSLEHIDATGTTSENRRQRDNVKGSALFYRSFYFLQLAWLYAKAYDETSGSSDLGIVLKMSTDAYEVSVRSSVRQTYEQIIKDAMAAIPLLPAVAEHPMRPSKAAAYGQLARAYQSMQKADSAYKYADLALKINSTLMDFNNTAQVSVNSGTPFKRFNPETIFFTQMTNDVGALGTFSALIDTTLYATYATADRRRTAYFAASGLYRKFKGNYTQSSSAFFTGIATDELYLIRAESSARIGNRDPAMADLNTLLKTRYNPGFVNLTATDAQDALQKILLERRKELLMRGLRWADVKRMNKQGANLILVRSVAGQPFTLPPNDNRFALPLPNDLVLLGIPQNPR